MTYIDDARARLHEHRPELPEPLSDLYVLLALVKGEAVTLQDVHDAWAIWQSRVNPEHRSIIPFDQLTAEIQALDKPYAEAIIAASR